MMRKHRFKISKLLSMTLALIMCAALAVPALAADGETSYTYDVFQIFTGQYADAEGDENMDGKVLSNVKWGQNGTGTEGEAVSDEILAELEDVLEWGEDNRDMLDFIVPNVDFDSTAWAVGKSLAEINAMTGVPSGYYLVRTNEASVPADGTYTTYVVNVIDSGFNITPKTGLPTVDKKADDAQKNDAAIGDSVTFTLTATLPENIEDYKEYFLQFNDTLSAGLTYNGDAKVEFVGAGGSVVDITEQAYIHEADGNLVVSFANLFAAGRLVSNALDISEMRGSGSFVVYSHWFAGAEIIVTYTATVNDKAALASDENTNKVTLTYSNDPNHSGDGMTGNDPENPPTPPDKTGTTVEGENTKTETWLTGLTVEHFGKNGKPMTGAEFELTGDSLNLVLKFTSKFDADENGNYYKLNSGAYTSAEPTDETRDQYDLAAGKFAKSDVLVTEGADAEKYVATIDENGTLSIGGLKSGDYVLKNTKIPNGYNLADDIEFTLSFDEENLFSSNNEQVQERTPEWFYVTIMADNGALLPETGGAGIAMFIMIGLAVFGCAGVSMYVLLKKKAAVK